MALYELLESAGKQQVHEEQQVITIVPSSPSSWTVK